MDFKKLYQSFKIYNRENSYDLLPDWAGIYDKDEPPIYWKCLKKRVENLPKEYRIVEIGSGFGAVTFLLAALGFKEVISIERKPELIEYSKHVLRYLELKNFKVICGSYPMDLGKIDVLVSVNCVYWDGISTREEYLKYVRNLFDFSGAKVFILEVIDKSFKAESSFPDFVKVSETEIHKIFFDCECTSELTFQYPNDKTTKRMFTITKNFFT